MTGAILFLSISIEFHSGWGILSLAHKTCAVLSWSIKKIGKNFQL